MFDLIFLNKDNNFAFSISSSCFSSFGFFTTFVLGFGEDLAEARDEEENKYKAAPKLKPAAIVNVATAGENQEAEEDIKTRKNHRKM